MVDFHEEEIGKPNIPYFLPLPPVLLPAEVDDLVNPFIQKLYQAVHRHLDRKLPLRPCALQNFRQCAIQDAREALINS